MTLIYQAITLIVLLLIGWHMLRERRLIEQMEAALVLLPLILRLLMIK
jgi:ABC-type molybdate transport system permease subunit